VSPFSNPFLQTIEKWEWLALARDGELQGWVVCGRSAVAEA